MTLVPGSQFTHFAYNPNLAANALYIAILSCCFLVQFVQGVRYRTWDFMVPMLIGLFLELMGYTARIFMHNDPNSRNAFLMDNITLILGPAFLAAAIYLCVGHIVRIYGESLSALKPRTYVFIFVACDLVNLILQGLGGGISSTQQHPKGIQAGIDIVISGLATQTASLLIFIACCTHFAINVHRHPKKMQDQFRPIRETKSFRAFLFAIGLGTICIFTRSVFRMVELREGFTGPLANSEVHFMVLEGGMILLATCVLTILHPGPCFQGSWTIREDKSDQGSEGGKYEADTTILLNLPTTVMTKVSPDSSEEAHFTRKHSAQSIAVVEVVVESK